MTTQIHKPRFERPPRIRSMITLEIASELLARATSDAPGAYETRIDVRQQSDSEVWFAAIVSGDAPKALAAVAAGRADLAIVAPADLASCTLPVRSIFTFRDCELVCRADAPADVIAAFRQAAETRLASTSEGKP
jgi:hypothetical protein